jgi:hypothetical protein
MIYNRENVKTMFILHKDQDIHKIPKRIFDKLVDNIYDDFENELKLKDEEITQLKIALSGVIVPHE